MTRSSGRTDAPRLVITTRWVDADTLRVLVDLGGGVETAGQLRRTKGSGWQLFVRSHRPGREYDARGFSRGFDAASAGAAYVVYDYVRQRRVT